MGGGREERGGGRGEWGEGDKENHSYGLSDIFFQLFLHPFSLELEGKGNIVGLFG